MFFLPYGFRHVALRFSVKKYKLRYRTISRCIESQVIPEKGSRSLGRCPCTGFGPVFFTRPFERTRSAGPWRGALGLAMTWTDSASSWVGALTFAGPSNLVRGFLGRRTWLQPEGNKRETNLNSCVEFGVSCPRRGVGRRCHRGIQPELGVDLLA